MADLTQKAAAKKFSEKWNGKGYEKGESQKFWIELLQEVFGISDVYDYITFEEQVHLDHTSFIDGYIPSKKVMIEQKGLNKSLDKPIKQSDGTMLTPFQQAKRYITELPVSQHPRWVITCNFAEFYIYDMEQPQGEPIIVKLAELKDNLALFAFLKTEEIDKLRKEEEISVKAGEITGKLYDALIKQYADPESDETLKSLNQLCVRLVFCLYAEDAGIFADNQFHDYVASFNIQHIRDGLKKLFKMLDTPDEERDLDDEPELLAFPYVNGGLFKDEKIKIPQFNEEIKALLLDEASAGIDWSDISPTIFGAVFESTLNPETRRSGGMHYTSVENIHKVIDPLFLNDLRAELDEILALKQEATTRKRVAEFQNKLSSLTFLDPACGSGNFLTETYLSLRRLENEALKKLYGVQIVLDSGDIIKVKINQFYGIEINDFAVTVAKTALWIAESQMLGETMDIVKQHIDFLPLKTNASIKEENALRYDWAELVAPEKLNYIMGNPPFLGHQNRNETQVEDLKIAFYDLEKHGKLDYVCGWYNKAADYIKDNNIKCAFVSTNSICQGESVGILWQHLFNKGIEIQYAYKTFIWNSEAIQKAHVHCVIIGFSAPNNASKTIFDGQEKSVVNHINGYLIPAPDVFIEARGNPPKGMPKMTKGSQPTDGGNLILSPEEREELLKKYPQTDEFIKRFVGADEFINNKYRYCLWLKDVSPAKYGGIKPIMERIKNVAEMRKNSPTESVRNDAERPALFTQIRQPESEYIIVPRHSSESRKYIPIGYMSSDIICGDANYMLPNAKLFHFGVLTSIVHNAWNRIICGRLEMRYRYTPAVYNNFPWCTPTDEQKAKIEQTAQSILDTRAKYPDSSLAVLYDPLKMPDELLKAHKENDKAVLAAYGLPKNATESEIVAFLFKRYAELTGGK